MNTSERIKGGITFSIDGENKLHILERIRGESGVGFFSYDEIVL